MTAVVSDCIALQQQEDNLHEKGNINMNPKVLIKEAIGSTLTEKSNRNAVALNPFSRNSLTERNTRPPSRSSIAATAP